MTRGTGTEHRGHRDTEGTEAEAKFWPELTRDKGGGSDLFELTDSGGPGDLGSYFFCARPTRKRDPSAHVVRSRRTVCREKRILLVAFSLRP